MSATAPRVSGLRLVGGRPCLDLVNTVSWRGDDARREDHLSDSAECLVWCRRAGVLDDDEAAQLGGLDVSARAAVHARRSVCDRRSL